MHTETFRQDTFLPYQFENLKTLKFAHNTE